MTERQSAPALDETDRQLIALLRDNARLQTATLAKRLGVSRGTVQNRIARLLDGGVLLGFTVRLRSEAEGGTVRAITSLEIRSSDHRPVVAALKRIPELTRIYSTNGRWDLVVEIQTADLPSLDRVLTEIRAIRAISNSETNVLLAEVG
ncbi:MAG TPA: Lrp/AsnC family transcriptional regulator [Alphaproteobacteria bacterium]|nr:Lrp/AsnC family transcriptional regulator [Alphaproteobacteria bacterium]